MPLSVWRVLHRAQHIVADPRDARRQAGGCALRAIATGFALRDFWPARTAGGMCQFAADSGNVWWHENGSHGVFGGARASHASDGAGAGEDKADYFLNLGLIFPKGDSRRMEWS